MHEVLGPVGFRIDSEVTPIHCEGVSPQLHLNRRTVDYRIIMFTRIIIADRIAIGRREERIKDEDNTLEEICGDVAREPIHPYIEEKVCFPAVFITDTSYTKIAF